MDAVLAVFYASTQGSGGKLGRDQFEKVLLTLGFPENDLEELFEVADVNQDGKIDCCEFIGWLFGSSGGFQLAGHPKNAVNVGTFIRSITEPEANGQPHYENGSFHLYCSGGQWRISASFEPTKNSCWSYIDPTASGAVPEGENEWDAFVDGSWSKVAISVTHVSSTALAQIAAGKMAAALEQAKQGLRFQGHPCEQVNFPAFIRSEEHPNANGFPHYENGWHLYFASGKWRIASTFEPGGTACWSYIDPTPSGCVPEGEREWEACVDGSWIKVNITVSPSSTAAAAEIDCKAVIEGFCSLSPDGKPLFSQDPFDDIYKMCTEQGAKFIDTNFPPVQSSLTRPGDAAQYNVDCWKRLSELCEHPYVYDDVVGHDIDQGAVGDCYMCTVLNGLAVTHFDLIKSVFSNKPQANSCGCYSLHLCDPRTKQWVYVLVDDYVPVQNGKPCFLKSKDKNEMWCSLLEKAMAKLAGSYARIDARYSPMPPILSSHGTQEVMEMLTGSVGLSVTFWIGTKPATEVWSKLQEVILNRWPTTTSCSATEEGQTTEGKDGEVGLVRHHSYSVVGAVQMPCGERLVRVRNPWGYFEWTGKWADDDAENWTDENRSFVDSVPEGGGALGHDRSDGMFFLPLHDYIEYFAYFQYCPIVGDSVWERLLEEQARAAQEQTKGGLKFSGHSQEHVNKTTFVHSQAQPEVNGKPHYENGSWHLYFSVGKWRVASKFTPTESSCWSFIDPTPLGTVPEGKNEWDACVDGSWVKMVVSVTHVSDSDLAEQEAENRRSVEHQAVRGLRFEDHPQGGVNEAAFVRSSTEADANGLPHYENGSWHLYYSDGHWRVASAFEPTKTSCFSYIAATSTGAVPEGTKEWTAYVDGDWTTVSITVTPHA
eukprot:TRINITY_DN75980_c0_g1_i1.p1 TRINITY_DN75980_c0_g1~~TRINITY_DN75980_c0_g1_i1.p1  ORF type:complete len:881 (-),score=116.29 TRINITY_DN75980_c0_g1_i1:37-2679(-)